MRAARVLGTAVLAGLFVTFPGVAPADGLLGGPPAATAAVPPAQEMLTMVNAARERVGCAAVELDGRLTAAATKHSTDMAGNDYFSHTGRNGSSFSDRTQAEGYPTPRSENIAAGETTAQTTFTQWMDSSGHRRNILDCSVKDMGLGVATDPGSTYRTYWTQEFGRG